MNNNIVQIIKYAWALMTLVYLSSSCPHVNRRYDQVSKTCVPQEHVFSGWHLPSDALREIAWYDWKSDHTLLFVLLDYLSSGRRKVSLWSFSNRTHTNVRIHSRLENFLTQQVDFPEDIIMSPNHRELLCPVGCVDEDAVAIVSLSSETIRFYTYLPHGVDFLIGWWPNSRGWLYRDAYNRIYLVSVTKGGPQKVSYLLRDDASPKWKALSEASVQEQFQVLPKATKYLLKAAVYNLPHEDTCNGNGGHLIYFVWYPLCQRLYGHGATRSRLIDLGKSWCALEISLSPDGKYVALLVEKNEQSSYPSLWRVLVGKTSEGVMHSVGSWRGNLYPYHNMEGGSVLRWSLDGKHLGVLLEDKRDNGVALYILNVPKSS